MIFVFYFLGHYIYTDPGDRTSATLLSSLIVSNNIPQCIELYYHMYGVDVGLLSVYVRNKEGEDTLLWRRVGNQGNKWRYVHIHIPLLQFQIVISATGSRGQRKVIAIDDIRISSCDTLSRYSCYYYALLLHLS